MCSIIFLDQIKTGGIIMKFMKKDGKGLLLCLVIAVPCWFLGNMIPVVGGAVFAMLAGMVTACFLKHREPFQNGIAFTAKYILQGAVIFLGFGMNLIVVIQRESSHSPSSSVPFPYH